MYDQRARADAEVAAIAARQHGVVSVQQLRVAGLDKHRVQHRVRTGRLHRVHRGVYAVGYPVLATKARWMAAALACSQAGRVNVGFAPEGLESLEVTMSILDYWGAALSHRAAASLWELLPPSDGPVDVSIRGYGGKRRRAGIRLHRSRLLLPAVVTLRSGIPVTTPSRTLADLRRVVSAPGKRGLISPRELRHVIRQANVAGLPTGEEERGDRARSDLERDFLRLCRRHHLPIPEVNVRIGRNLVDFLWRNHMLVVETDATSTTAAAQPSRTTGRATSTCGREALK